MNGIVLFGVMAMFGFTFSLPSIAGMVLIIGMAVDANVLIYERLREEMENGKSLKNAISSAYEKAFSAIFDSNVTSLITAIILIAFGSSALKGFAITLSIGILASMFSAILVTRVLFRWGIDLKMLRNLSFLNLVKSANYDFLGKRRLCAAISLGLLLVALSAFGIRNERALGVDFTGGTMIEFQLGKDIVVPLADVENAVKSLNLTKEAYPQEQSSPATGILLTVRCDTSDAELITTTLRESIPALGETKAGSETDYVIDSSKDEVSSVVGGTFLIDSVIALVIGLLAILLYVTVRFEFAFAVGAFVAILHDVIISVGIVVLLEEGLHKSYLVGFGWNETDRFRVTLGWYHLNLFGGAHAFSAETVLSSREQRFQLGLREPRLPKLDLPAYLVVYQTYEEFPTYSQRRRGLWIDVGDRHKLPFRSWLRYLYQILSYSLLE